MRTALHHRVSTTEQDPSAPRHDLRAAATARGYEIAMEVEETGSGAQNDRPGLQNVMAAALRGRIDVVIVWKLDRFGRSALDLLVSIRQLVDAGARFEAIKQRLVVDPRRVDPTATLILTVLAAVAAFERDLIRERTLLGLERARRAGKRLGRPPRLVDPEDVATLRARASPGGGSPPPSGAASSPPGVRRVRKGTPETGSRNPRRSWGGRACQKRTLFAPPRLPRTSPPATPAGISRKTPRHFLAEDMLAQ
ncbi:MAG: recombinase family protein [Acidobacteriota bacterium]